MTDNLKQGYSYINIGKYKILMYKDSKSLTFRDYGRKGDKRAIAFHKDKDKLCIAIEIPKRKEYEGKNKQMNAYALYKKQKDIVMEWLMY